MACYNKPAGAPEGALFVRNNPGLTVAFLLTSLMTALIASASTASAQDCDPRYDPDCRRSAQPPLPFPFFLFAPPPRDTSRDTYRDPRDAYPAPDAPGAQGAPGPYRQPPPRQSYSQPNAQDPYGQPPPAPYYGRPPAQAMPQPQMPPRPGAGPYDRPYDQPYDRPYDSGGRRDYASLYAGVPNEPFPIPSVDLSQIGPQFLRTTVSYPTREAPGTIIIDPRNHFLYYIEGGGRATRYGVGVGREGFGWSGVAAIHDKQEWPPWYPPREMLARQPELMRQMSELPSGIGMPGGGRNPLGSRAMYLWQGERDTLYRIHGTVEPWTIGKSVSSGCIRMINQDVIDLYARAQLGAKVVVLP
jgi:lipoprotein-anchoring transpeptidase ErfK/SrfK